MSLRVRLSLLYSSLFGGILLIFGVIIYQLVSVNLISHLDETLAQTANDIMKANDVNLMGELKVISPDFDLAANVYIQYWDRSGMLRDISPNLSNLSTPMDPTGLVTFEPIFADSIIDDTHLRVLSVPLLIGNRPIGTLQVGANLSVVHTTQRVLLTTLITGVLLAMGAAAIAVSISTYQALKPLESVTKTALQITRADDLSRRIPYTGSKNDEIGQLILAFNQTLGRLENLFLKQRRFIADVGHELRTPLTVIKGNATLLRRIGCADDESLSGIENEVDRLTRMVGDLLLLAQAESGKMMLDLRKIELDTLLLEVLQQTSVLARDRVKLRIGDIDQVILCADRDRIKQVILNLIGNAIKYTPSGGEVLASLGKVEDQSLLTITDNGPGIPPEDLPHIFERFYRTEKSRTRSSDGKGFGLGLSIAYWIVKEHGGDITVESTEGKGSKFSLWLPLPDETTVE